MLQLFAQHPKRIKTKHFEQLVLLRKGVPMVFFKSLKIVGEQAIWSDESRFLAQHILEFVEGTLGRFATKLCRDRDTQSLQEGRIRHYLKKTSDKSHWKIL